MIKRLKELRIEKQITQKKIAERLNITQQTYSDYETGRTNPDIETLIKICDFLEISTDYLIGRSDDFGNVTIYPQTENVNALSSEEQKTIDIIRNKQPYRVSEWLEIYAALPSYLQENIFAELKGISLATKTTKKTKEGE